MKLLVTGCDGYLGSLVAPELLRKGHDVTGVDTGFFREGTLFRTNGISPKTISKDIRHLQVEDLKGFEGMVHMADLSNDPMGELAPQITHEINHQGSVRLARLAKQAGVKRYVYMSSCSVYGVSDSEYVDEESPVNPQTAYAVCKTEVEREVRELADDDFSPVFLRNATAYGASPRMRFDTVLNNLAGMAWITGEIKMTSDGSPWRPMVHGLDIAQMIALALDAPKDAVHNQIFNVGDTDHNYRVRDIATVVGEVFTGCRVSFGPPSADNRSYRVSFEKIRKHLPAFKCAWNLRRGAEQLQALFTRIDMKPEVFQHRAFTRLKELQYLIRTGQIDEHFFWTTS